MNNNSYDKDKKQSDEQNYEVYSREYKYSHSYPHSEVEKSRTSSGGKNFLVIAVAIVISLFVGAASMWGVANMIFDEPESSNVAESTDAPSHNAIKNPETTAAPTQFGDEVFFGSADDTKINISNSEGITMGGTIGSEGMTYADVAALVKDSVVEITTSETSYNGMIYESGAGSGVIVKESGIIITNNHVIDGASYITVRLTNGSTYNAVPVASDAASDIAILKIEPTENLTVAVFGNSDRLVVGEEVMAIGNPLGILGGTVTHGIVSALEREVTIDNEKMILLQHNAAVSPGNSGGALFNMRGELVGIVNAKSSGNGAEGIGFAIPANTVLTVYNDLVSVGYVKGRPDSGLTLQTVVKRVGYFYYEYEVCIMASRYTDELKPNDIIVSIDGVEPANITEAEYLLSGHEIGDEVTIVVSRADGNHTVKLIIREYTPVQ